MKSRIATVSAIAAGLLCPAGALAAQGEPSEGSWFALIFYALNFLLFLWIVRRYGWPRVTQFFRDRAHTMREIRGRADKAYREAQELAQRAAQLLQQLEAEKSRIAAELDAETNDQIGQIDRAAGEAVNRIRHDTEVTVAALREGAQRRLRQTMAAAAGRVARELVRLRFQASDQARLLEGFIDSLAEEAHL